MREERRAWWTLVERPAGTSCARASGVRRYYLPTYSRLQRDSRGPHSFGGPQFIAMKPLSLYGSTCYTVYLVLTPVSDISGLPYLQHQGEVLSLRDHHKRILRPILGLGRDRYVFAVYHPCWLVTTPGVLISGHVD